MAGATHQTVRLSRGKHASPLQGACVMELASMLAGEPFTDRPGCVDPVIAAYLRALNDIADDEQRQQLYRYASAAVGTRGDEELRRRRIERCGFALDAATHRFAPGRLVGRALASSAQRSPLALEQFGLRLVRTLRRSGPGWEQDALALADDLIAMTASARRSEARGATRATPAAVSSAGRER
jgi:hypothetical protein